MDNKKEYEAMREAFKAMLDVKENMYPEMEPIADWLDLFTTKMRKACAEAMSQFPKGQDGPGEAFMIGLARFNCMVLEKFQNAGFVTEGNNAYDIFYEVLMPTAHEMVLREIGEQRESDIEETAEAVSDLAEDLMNPEISIDAIIDRHFRDDMTAEQRQKAKEKLQNLRDIYLNKEDTPC